MKHLIWIVMILCSSIQVFAQDDKYVYDPGFATNFVSIMKAIYNFMNLGYNGLGRPTLCH